MRKTKTISTASCLLEAIWDSQYWIKLTYILISMLEMIAAQI